MKNTTLYLNKWLQPGTARHFTNHAANILEYLDLMCVAYGVHTSQLHWKEMVLLANPVKGTSRRLPVRLVSCSQPFSFFPSEKGKVLVYQMCSIAHITARDIHTKYQHQRMWWKRLLKLQEMEKFATGYDKGLSLDTTYFLQAMGKLVFASDH